MYNTMTQQTRKRKKKRQRSSRASNPSGNDSADDGHLHDQQQHHQQQLQQSKTVLELMEAFDSVSLQQASAACRDAGDDVNKAAEVLANSTDNSEDPFTSSDIASTSTSTSGSSEGFMEPNVMNRKGIRGTNKHKRVVAVTGTVSTVLGKEYVKASPRRGSSKAKHFQSGVVDKEQAEQFLCSMLGYDSELSMAVVRDVLCQCGYNLEKALDALLDLSASSSEQSSNSRFFDTANYEEDASFSIDNNDNVTDRASDCTSYSAESEVHESIWGNDCRNYTKAPTSFEAPSTSPRIDVSDLPQKVLESLFNIPRSSEHEPSTMNWRLVAEKMQLLGPGINTSLPSDAFPQQEIYAKGAEYHLFRKPANQHWDSMRSYYEKAAMAYSKGDRAYAAYLSDQGKLQAELAQKADEKASQDIFKARNKGIENVITIDLHGQHVKQAMRMLKLHLLFGTHVRSIKTLRVITGCGSHGVGKSKLKQSIIKLLEKEGIEWSEENRGAVLIKVDGSKEYSFLDSDSDNE